MDGFGLAMILDVSIMRKRMCKMRLEITDLQVVDCSRGRAVCIEFSFDCFIIYKVINLSRYIKFGDADDARNAIIQVQRDYALQLHGDNWRDHVSKANASFNEDENALLSKIIDFMDAVHEN